MWVLKFVQTTYRRPKKSHEPKVSTIKGEESQIVTIIKNTSRSFMKKRITKTYFATYLKVHVLCLIFLRFGEFSLRWKHVKIRKTDDLI